MKAVLFSLLGTVILLCGICLTYFKQDVAAFAVDWQQGGTTALRMLQPASVQTGVLLEVETLLQNPELPNGCEATSLAVLLRYLGYYTDNLELAYEYIPREELIKAGGTLYGPDPAFAYAGDPASSSNGYYCLAPALVEGAANYLHNAYADADVLNLSGATLEQLCSYVEAGSPVVVWTTMDYGPAQYCGHGWRTPAGEECLPYANLHCVVLAGYEEGTVILSDPLQTNLVYVDAGLFENGYRALGSQAMTVQLV